MSMSMALIMSFLGLFLFWMRLSPGLFLRRDAFDTQQESLSASQGLREWPLCTVVTPCRNEEANLPRLLSSFEKIQYNPIQFVFVDDQSTDRTRELLEEFARRHPHLRVDVISGRERPENWTGKNWACHQGAEAARGEFILFTDADTAHDPAGLIRSVSQMQAENLDLLSATPSHISESWWERLLGPFQILVLFSTAAYSRPRPGRVFAIGQYLLFRQTSYWGQGGHEAVRNLLCEDLELAAIALKRGLRYKVDFSQRVFHVRMYSSFEGFVTGWRRIFRLGLKHTRVSAPLEIYALLAASTAGMRFFAADTALVAVMLVCLVLMLALQVRLGNFSPVGVLFWPFSLCLFIGITFLATLDLLVKREYSWRGRTYTQTGD